MKILIAYDEDNDLEDYFCFMCERAITWDASHDEAVHNYDSSPVCEVPTENEENSAA